MANMHDPDIEDLMDSDEFKDWSFDVWLREEQVEHSIWLAIIKSRLDVIRNSIDELVATIESGNRSSDGGDSPDTV